MLQDRDTLQARVKVDIVSIDGIVEGKEDAGNPVTEGYKAERQPATAIWPNDKQKADETSMVDELNRLTTQLFVLQNHSNQLENDKRHLIEVNRDLQTKLNRAEAEHNRTRSLLSERTTELRGAQVFLSKADSTSGGEVIQMVESLNSEILQAAALMADGLGQKVETVSEADIKGATERLRPMLGSGMIACLNHRSPHSTDGNDRLLAQIAIQVCLINLCVDTAESWCHWEGHYATFLAKVYSKIQEAENQTVSGRWRAITRAQLKRFPGHKRLDDRATYIVQRLFDILTVTGWLAPSPAPVLSEVLYTRIVAILNMSLELQTILGENITSGDVHMLYIPRHKVFDPKTMEDGYAGSDQQNGRRSKPDYVICTTDLGLRKDVKGSESIVILKPKVMLYAAMDDMLAVQAVSSEMK